MPCLDTENTPLPGDTENVLLRKLLNRLCNVTSGGGGGVSQAYVDARDAATLASANANAVAGDVATLAAAMSSASALYVLKSGDTMTGALLQPAGSVGAPALSRSGDTDTGIWYPAANTWAISTAGAERVRIDSAGLVGIGETAPNVKLQIRNAVGGLTAVGSARVLTLDGSGAINELVEIGIGSLAGLSSANSPGLIGYKTSDSTDFNKGDLYFATRNVTTNTAASVRMTILDDGNVGIGITAPLAKLHVTPAASGTDYFRIDHSDGTPRLQVGAVPSATTYGGAWLGSVVPSATNYTLIADGTNTILNSGVTAGNIYLAQGGTAIWNVQATTGHFLAFTDNTYDIGAAGATRPRNYFGAGTVNAAAGLITGNVASLVTSSAAMNNGAAAALGTLTDAPAAGNPTKWIPIDDNGTIRYIPAW